MNKIFIILIFIFLFFVRIIYLDSDLPSLYISQTYHLNEGYYTIPAFNLYHYRESRAILLNNEKLVECTEIIREKETNRSIFFRGQIDKHNGHLFYIESKNIKIRPELIIFLKKHEIYSGFHYIPLHSSPSDLKYRKFKYLMI